MDDISPDDQARVQQILDAVREGVAKPYSQEEIAAARVWAAGLPNGKLDGSLVTVKKLRKSAEPAAPESEKEITTE